MRNRLSRKAKYEAESPRRMSSVGVVLKTFNKNLTYTYVYKYIQVDWKEYRHPPSVHRNDTASRYTYKHTQPNSARPYCSLGGLGSPTRPFHNARTPPHLAHLCPPPSLTSSLLPPPKFLTLTSTAHLIPSPALHHSSQPLALFSNNIRLWRLNLLTSLMSRHFLSDVGSSSTPLRPPQQSLAPDTPSVLLQFK